MPEAIWIDRGEELPPLARTLESHASIGLDTEFLRERTFFPKLCLLQLAGGRRGLVRRYLARRQPRAAGPCAHRRRASRKVIHSARQDLEAFYLSAKRVISPVFDTQIAAGCIGLKPQIGYAELVKTLLDVTLPKAKRAPTGRSVRSPGEQLEYAADDVLYLERDRRPADRAAARAWGARNGFWRIVSALEDPRLYEPDPARAWKRLRGLKQLPPARARPREEPCGMARKGRARTRSAARLDHFRCGDLQARRASPRPCGARACCSLPQR